MPPILRILDANANRAREALRVMEESARFILDDAPLTQELKTLRHDLAAALAPLSNLPYHRDTPADVGREAATPTEHRRDSAAEVALAAGKRLTEALRSLEEYAKALTDQVPTLSRDLETLRYRAYTLDQRLTTALATGRARQWRLCLLLTESHCAHHPWEAVLEGALDAGIDCIQVREKDLDAGTLFDRAREVVRRVAHRAAVIINDRADIALAAGADGVHLGQTDLPPREVRKLVGRQLLVGVSTSNLDQAKRALEEGADYCGVGPMFHTTTKQKDFLAGPNYLRDYLDWNCLPHLAIGGITPDNIHELVAAGVRGIAVSSAICAAADPGRVTRTLLGVLNRTTI